MLITDLTICSVHLIYYCISLLDGVHTSTIQLELKHAITNIHICKHVSCYEHESLFRYLLIFIYVQIHVHARQIRRG